MNKKIAIFAAVLAGVLPLANAQLYTAVGVSTGIQTNFNFTIDPTLNQVTVQVQNNLASSVTGVVTSFGFNVPASLETSSVSLISQSWDILVAGHTDPAGNWSVIQPYDLSPAIYVQDVGAAAGTADGGNVNQGVWFGETATFVFQFANFADATGFLGANGMSARWQAVVGSQASQSDKGWGNYNDGEVPPFDAVPEPSTYGLIGVGVLLVGIMIRRRRATKITA